MRKEFNSVGFLFTIGNYIMGCLIKLLHCYNRNNVPVLKDCQQIFCLFRIHHKKRLPHKRTIFRNYVSLLVGRNISKAYTFTQYTWNQGLVYLRHSAGGWMPECVVNLKTRSQIQLAKNFLGERGSKNYILEYTDLDRNPWCANYRRWTQRFQGGKEKIW